MSALKIVGITIAAAFILWFMVSFWIGFTRGNAAPIDCHTSYMSSQSYTYCYYTDDTGYRYGTVTICNPNGNCTTRNM